MVEFDVLIQNAVIVEGTGKEAYKGSIGVVGDKVAAIGEVKGDAKRVIDARGLTALPGLVEAHSHADQTMLWHPGCDNYIMQGVTTLVAGQCGGTMAPVGEYVRVPRDINRSHLNRLDPYFYHANKPYYPLDQVNAWMKEIFGWTIDWKTMAGFFEKVEKVGISCNFAPLVGFGTCRTVVMGLDYKRNATEKEVAAIQEHIVEGMEAGCIGLSAGLDYDPDVFASHEEVVQAVQTIKKYNGVYCPHWRRTGRRRDVAMGHVPNEKITALMECVDVHKRTGVRLHFAHINTGWDIYPNPPEELEEANVKLTLDMISRDSKGELDITWDAIPFLMRGARLENPYLASLLAPWDRLLGGREALGKWLKVKDFREEVKDAMRRGRFYWREMWNPNQNPRWAENLWVSKSKVPELDGKSIAEIARERKVEAMDAFFDAVAEDPDAFLVTAPQPRDCYNHYFTNPKGMVGLDVDTLPYDYFGTEPPYTKRGLNMYSGYSIFLNKMVKEKKIFTLEEAVQKTSTMPARVHNLEGRGVLQKGGYADILLMDWPNLKVLATEVEPRVPPKGIEYVFVNGVLAVEKGKHTGARAGRVLRRKG